MILAHYRNVKQKEKEERVSREKPFTYSPWSFSYVWFKYLLAGRILKINTLEHIHSIQRLRKAGALFDDVSDA